MRAFRDAAGMEWVVFFTARSVARDHHLPAEYRDGWLAFESVQGEKRRIAPAPKNWESLSDQELASLSGQAVPQSPRKKAAPPSDVQVEAHVNSSRGTLADAWHPQLREAQAQLSSALDEICDLPAPDKLDTGELIRVEETLAIAAEAAKEAVSLRRKQHADRNR